MMRHTSLALFRERISIALNEKIADGCHGHHVLPLRRLAPPEGQEAVLDIAAFVQEPVQQKIALAARDRQAKVVGGDVLQRVGFVEDDDLILR